MSLDIGPVASPPAQQNVLLIRVYGWYRVVLSVLLLIVLLSSGGKPIVGRFDPDLFGWLCAGYFALSVLLLILVAGQRSLRSQQLFAIFCIDIAVLIALSHVSGGIRSGLAPLLLVVVASASMVLRGQIALLVAAIATLSLLADTFYLISVDRDDTASLLPAATLGVLAFATSIALRYLSQRLSSTQALAQQRAQDVSKLQHLNHLIVQRMRTGILVIDHLGNIKMMNRAATELLHAEGLQDQLSEGLQPPLTAPLQQRLLAWQENSFNYNRPFVIGEAGPELIARFTRLDDDTGDTLIFLEDSGQIAQRAQQLKLAALGRLTASIAHEIRNPLGAVSHAAQLLQESPELAEGDRRLADIMQNHARRMNAIIENVLQLSRRTPPDPQRLLLTQWLHPFVDDYRQGCEEGANTQIEITERAPVEITFDPGQLEQVLTNLLDNALRYSEKATGERRAWLVVSEGPNRLPQLEVVDDGPGIDDQVREKIFEPFFTTESKGNGLGLYIARELCEINQARLAYLRSDDGRSSFRISFSHPDRRPLINE